MKFKIKIQIMPLNELLDPQGKAVESTLINIGFLTIENVRIGKNIEFLVEANNIEDAEIIVKNACEKMLYNQVMESYQYTIDHIIARTK